METDKNEPNPEVVEKLQKLLQYVELAHKRGAYSLEEAHNLFILISFFIGKKD